MAKTKYSEVKHEDKFHEALSRAWERIEPYALRAGIAVGALLVAAAAWLYVAQRRTSSQEQPWAERFEIGRRYADLEGDDAIEQTTKLLAELEAFAQKHQGRPVAAVTLLEVARAHLGLADAERAKDPDAAAEHLQRAAAAAEQFIADFPDHPHIAHAHYDAGKARLDLGKHAQAAAHFERAMESDVEFLAALARLQAGLCYEKLGELAKARMAFEAARDSKGADDRPTWCAEQAEHHLARLRRSVAEGS